MLRAIRVGSVIVPVVPRRIAYRLCAIIGFLAYLINAPARRGVLGNLEHVEPERGPISRRRQALRVFATTVTNYYDLVLLRTFDRDRFAESFKVLGEEHIQAALAKRSGVIVFSAHVGNFNVVASYPPVAGFKAAVVAERVEPPELFRYVTRLRTALGIEIISPGSESIRPILRMLRANQVVVVACDRDIAGNGIEVDFFGDSAHLPFGPVVLAMRTGASLLPVSTIRTSHGQSLIIADAPLELVRTGDWDSDLRENMEQVARGLEVMIKRDPGQWSVLHSIWTDKRTSTLPAEPTTYRHQAAQLEQRLLATVQHSRARRRFPRHHSIDSPTSSADSDNPDR